jgi:POT family proton-dependent oligopeptide transporter
MAVAFAYASGVQALIYSAAPCYTNPLACPASNHGTIPNHVNVFIQAPVYIIVGLSEIFFINAGKEFAYNHSPPSMKSFIQAIYYLANAVGSSLGAALAPVSHDPHMLVFYASMASIMFCTAIMFFFSLQKYN